MLNSTGNHITLTEKAEFKARLCPFSHTCGNDAGWEKVRSYWLPSHVWHWTGCHSSRCAWLTWHPKIQKVHLHIRAAQVTQKTCLCPANLHCGSANAPWLRTGTAMKYINPHSQLLSPPTVPGWRISEFLNHRHTSPAWLCINATWKHRTSCPDLTVFSKVQLYPQAWARLPGISVTSKPWVQGFPSFSTPRDLLFILQTATAIANPQGIHPHSAASPELAQDPSSAPANTAVPGSKHPRKGGSGVKGFVRHRTASTHSPSQHSAGTWS